MHWRARLTLACVIGCTIATAARTEPVAPSVLTLYQAGAGVQAYADISEAFRRTVNRDAKSLVAVYEENLDLSRFGGTAYQQTVARYLDDKYRNIAIGAVLAVGDKAFEFAVRFREGLWPNAPIVFAALDSGSGDIAEPPLNTTGVAVRMTLADMVSSARVVVPNLGQVALVGDPLEKQTFRSHFVRELPAALSGLELIDLTGLPIREVTQRVAVLPDTSAILYTTINIDGEGKVFTPRAALALIAAAANRPIVVDVVTNIGDGATGGLVFMPGPVGHAAARLVLRILNGEDASQIPVTNQSDAVKPVFDWRQLQRWHVAETRLPAGADIRFRQSSFWEQHYWQIMALLLAVLLQPVLLTAIIFEHRLRRTAQAKSAELAVELAHMNRRATAGELVGSIAHELRQPLAAIVASAGAGQNWLKQNVPSFDEARRAFQNIAKDAHRADDVIENVRAMFKKKSSPHQPLDVNDALEQVVAHVQRRLDVDNISLTKVLASDPVPVVLGDRVQLQQVFLNLVMNAIEAMNDLKSRSHYLELRTEIDDERVVVSVGDSGPGISEESIAKIFAPFYTTKPEGMGMGLSICQSIIEAHGGRLKARAGKYVGLVVEVELPLHTGEVRR
jgi:signal transduction histidine kinase